MTGFRCRAIRRRLRTDVQLELQAAATGRCSIAVRDTGITAAAAITIHPRPIPRELTGSTGAIRSVLRRRGRQVELELELGGRRRI